MERVDREKVTHFHERIEKFCKWWKKEAPELTIACSHGDWLPIATEILHGKPIDFDKGSWAEFSLDGSKVVLKSIVQDPADKLSS